MRIVQIVGQMNNPGDPPDRQAVLRKSVGNAGPGMREREDILSQSSK